MFAAGPTNARFPVRRIRILGRAEIPTMERGTKEELVKPQL